MKFKKALFPFAFLVLLSVAVLAGQDISTILGAKVGQGSAQYTADSTGSAVDVGNYGACMLVINSASETYNATDGWKIQVLHCDTSDGTFAEVTSKDIVGATPDASGTIHTINASQTTPQIAKYGYVGEKRYLKIRLDEQGTATFTGSVAIIGGRLKIAPE